MAEWVEGKACCANKWLMICKQTPRPLSLISPLPPLHYHRTSLNTQPLFHGSVISNTQRKGLLRRPLVFLHSQIKLFSPVKRYRSGLLKYHINSSPHLRHWKTYIFFLYFTNWLYTPIFFTTSITLQFFRNFPISCYYMLWRHFTDTQ